MWKPHGTIGVTNCNGASPSSFRPASQVDYLKSSLLKSRSKGEGAILIRSSNQSNQIEYLRHHVVGGLIPAIT